MVRAYNARSTKPLWHYWNPADNTAKTEDGEPIRIALCGATCRDDMLDENTGHIRGCRTCDDQERRLTLALSVLARHGRGGCSAALVGRNLNPTARMAHLAASSTLASLESRGLAKRKLSNTWSSGVYLWEITPKGLKAIKASRRGAIP